MFLFCKLKTAYECRISDWSSDVCSSDLLRVAMGGGTNREPGAGGSARKSGRCGAAMIPCTPVPRPDPAYADRPDRGPEPFPARTGARPQRHAAGRRHGPDRRGRGREIGEHTSELPSLMRISYAVFCLK